MGQRDNIIHIESTSIERHFNDNGELTRDNYQISTKRTS